MDLTNRDAWGLQSLMAFIYIFVLFTLLKMQLYPGAAMWGVFAGIAFGILSIVLWAAYLDRL